MHQFREDFLEQLSQHIEHLLASQPFDIDALHDVYGFLEDFSNRGGKCIRPYLASIFMVEDKKSKELWNVLCAIEMFHIFALIHDDIIDESSTRRGKPTLNRMCQQWLQDKNIPDDRAKHLADGLSLLLGDILLCHSQNLFYTNYAAITPQPCQPQMVVQWMSFADYVVAGQCVDVLGEVYPDMTKEQILEKSYSKSGDYTIVRPLCFGASIAGIQDLTPYQDFGYNAGIGFQLRDDLLDILGDPAKTGKQCMQDITNRQPTLISWYIRNTADTKYKDVLESYWGKALNKQDIQTLQGVFVDSGAIDFCEAEIARYKTKALQIIQTSDIPSYVSAQLVPLIDMLLYRSK